MKARVNRWLSSAWAKPVWCCACLLPLVWLVYAAAGDLLGANPAQALVRSTGDWTLRALCLVLAVSPVRLLTGLTGLARFRRMAGLFVYFYALLHGLSYAWFDMGLEWEDIARDIAKRPFILVGFSALVLLTPLALTSFNRAIRALGARRWQQLHRLVFGVAVLAVLHFFWMRAGKNDFREVAVYAAILGLLLGWRVRLAWRSPLRPAPVMVSRVPGDWPGQVLPGARGTAARSGRNRPAESTPATGKGE